MRITGVVAAAVLVLFACGESASPRDAVGTYSLTTVGGQPLPYIVEVSDPDTTLITSSVVRLNADDSWLVLVTIEHTIDGDVHMEGETGAWALSDTVLSLTVAPGVGTYAAALSGANLVVRWASDLPVMVYAETATDNTAPTVVSRSPAPGATGVAADPMVVTATFGEMLDGRYFTASDFTLTGPGGAVAGTVDYGDTWATWQFEPTAPLAVSTTYTAKIAGTVTDLAGNAVGADITWSFTTGASYIEFVLVPAGAFQMGDEFGTVQDELPVHTVTLTHAFYIGKYQVTQAQWRAVMGTDPSNHADCDECPVERVSWQTVQQFIAALNTASGHAGCTTQSGCYRLPTEAEWEYAAKGGAAPGDGTEWAGSNTAGDVAWYVDNAGDATHPVGQKAPNGLGLYDMSGNVWEWVQDWYSETYYATSPSTNPTGPASGGGRVLRGGSFEWDAFSCRVAMRTLDDPTQPRVDDGFRLVRVK